MTLPDLMKGFSDDACCRELLERLRWPTGAKCIRCGGEVSRRKEILICNPCHYEFRVTTATIFGDTHLPLEKWFLAVLLLVEARKGMSAMQLERTIGVSYKTAWYLCHRIRAAMATAERLPLTGTVELDETYVGGVERGGKRGRGTDKDIVLGIRQRGGDLRFFHVEDVKSGTLAKYVQAHSKGIYVDGDIHTNTVENAFSLLKRGVIGSWHKISAKHLQRYLAEMEFRFNRRKRSDLFVDTLRHMVTADPLSFAELIK